MRAYDAVTDEYLDEERAHARDLAHEANDMLPEYLHLDLLRVLESMHRNSTDRRVARFLAETICEEYGWPDDKLSFDHLSESGWSIYNIAEIARRA